MFTYTPQFRVVPTDGPEVTYSMTTLTSTGGAVSTLVGYEPLQDARPSPLRTIIRRSYGFRPYCEFLFELVDFNDEASLAAIASAAIIDGTQIFLSLNAGTTEREVVLDSDYPRDQLGGKAISGISTRLRFLAVGIIETIPALQDGGW